MTQFMSLYFCTNKVIAKRYGIGVQCILKNSKETVQVEDKRSVRLKNYWERMNCI